MFVKKIIGAVLVLCLLVSPSLWAGPKIQSWQTANGARVLFVAAPDLPMVDIRVVFDAGSARDGQRPGLSRLTNALLTEGAGEWNADQIAERMESVGADLGSGSLRDMAWLSLRTLSAEGSLNTSTDTMTAILTRPTFPADALERDRQAMLAGLRQEEQSPGALARKRFMRELYGEHPYAIHSGGTDDSLKAITADEIRSFYRRFYVARNAVVALVGDLDREQAAALAEKIVGKLPAGEPAPDLPAVQDLKGKQEIQQVFPSTQSHILVGQPGMRRDDPDFFPLSVGNHILGGSGLVSQLSDEVREKRGLSYSVYSYFSPMHARGPFVLGAQTQNAKVKETLRVMRDTLARFIEHGPTEKELQAAKQNITGGFPLEIASNSRIVGQLAMIGFYRLPLDYLDTYVGKVDAVTREQIRDAFQRRVHPDRMVTVVVGNSNGD